MKVICTSQGANGKLDYCPTVPQSHFNIEEGEGIFLQFNISFTATAYEIPKLSDLLS